jgi:lipopolysaccharide transport system ATP-binding protein
MTTAIEVRDLGKRYLLGRHDVVRPYNTLRETIATSAKRLAAHLCARVRTPSDAPEFWALREATFDVSPGEVVGIVGRNGAGKSTLLKILSRIIQPTRGSVVLRGRVSSLLEVGTGFHPELTGRENIFLNGSILGMSRREIARKFDEIVAFAEVEQFLQTPVKRYSSGMYVRLAFAVAAHLDSEILIVDEILSVGDARFQKKCLGTMNKVAKDGHTVFFVSHNMQAVTTLCKRALLLEHGRIIQDGGAKEVVEAYLSSKAAQSAEISWGESNAPGDRTVVLRAVRVLDAEHNLAYDHDLARSITIQCDVQVHEFAADLDVGLQVVNHDGVTLFAVGTAIDEPGVLLRPGTYRTECSIPGHFFNDGTHYVSVCLVRHKSTICGAAPECVSFCTHDYGAGRDGYFGKINGVIRPRFPWFVQCIADELVCS